MDLSILKQNLEASGYDVADWQGDGGRITQMTVNSVWSQPELGSYTVTADQPQDFGKRHQAALSQKKEDGSNYEDESDLLNEYKLCSSTLQQIMQTFRCCSILRRSI